ncbi:5174_t:CDS:2 [Funneliformis mosseae]|uniref:5174_t:CDS:1 n=1 Tax=Funneliformis mosseae TaxID=27381 RepID=A0A9N9HD75_FUNMO|nr:5174_t:CDS:2 [Funneliformis mosseae]
MGLLIYEEKITTITLTEFQGYNTEKLFEFLRSEEQLRLIQEGFDILKNERICGGDFLELTMKEFSSSGMKIGPAKRISKFTNKLKNELEQFEAKLEQSRNQLEYDYTDYGNSVKKSSPPLIPTDFKRLNEGTENRSCNDVDCSNGGFDSNYLKFRKHPKLFALFALQEGMRANKRREADILRKCLDFLKKVSSEDVKKRINMLLQGFDVSYIKIFGRMTRSMGDFQQSREGTVWKTSSSPEKGSIDYIRIWNKIELMCYENEQKRLESERATRTLRCHVNIRDKTQNMMENMAEETVEEAENARKRSRSEFTEYEQNDEGLSVLSSPPSKIRTTCGTEVERTDNDSTFSDEESLSAPLTNAFTETSSQQSDTNIGNSDLASAQIAKVQKPRKYINRDIADDVLKNYKTSILPGEKLV